MAHLKNKTVNACKCKNGSNHSAFKQSCQLHNHDWIKASVTRKKLQNVYKSCPKIISLEKWLILKPLQKLPKNVGDLGKLIVAKGFKKVAQSPINRPIWSHWSKLTMKLG